MKRRHYAFEFTPRSAEHLAALSAQDRALVVDSIERQIRYQPTVETRNRKRMDPDKRLYIAPWELG